MERLSKIDEFVYITDANFVEEQSDQLRNAKIGRVLTLLNSEIEKKWRIPSIEYRWIQMDDTLSQDILSNGNLAEALQFIGDSVQKGIRIVVHCQVGVSRSPSIVMAYLMKKNRWNVAEARDHVKARRSFICPNISFMNQLEVFAALNYQCDPTTVKNSPQWKAFVEANPHIS